MASTLRNLRVALHVSFALLLLFALGRVIVVAHAAARNGVDTSAGGSIVYGTPAFVAALVVGVVLGGLYLVGTVYEKRSAHNGVRASAGASVVWLACVLALWLVLVALSVEFAWVVFPLFFVVLHVLERPVAYAVLGCLVAAVGVSFMVHTDSQSPALLIGPAVGASAAAAMYWIYSQLVANVHQQQQVIADLERTRQALAITEREAGRLMERERVARDIHDTLAQGFSSIILMKRGVAGALSRGDVSLAQQRLDVIGDTAAESLQQARSVVAQLRSSDLKLNLVENLTQQVRHAQSRAVAAGSLTNYSLRSDSDVVLAEAHTVQEFTYAVAALIANVEQHAQARTCVVSVTDFDTEIVIDIYDDGVGFDPQALAGTTPVRDDGGAGGGFGLVALRERMAELGGSVLIESAANRGTVVTLTVPTTIHPTDGAAGAGGIVGKEREDDRSRNADPTYPHNTASTPTTPTRKDHL